MTCTVLRLLTIGSLVLVPSCRSASKAPTPSVSQFTPAREAKSQDEAWAQARKIDLPAITKADHLEIILGIEIQTNPKIIPIDVCSRIDAFRRDLRVTADPPSAGQATARLVFSRGRTLIGTVWVYPNGEWGVQRPGVSWTCGVSGKLADAINEVVKSGATSDVITPTRLSPAAWN